MKRAMTIFFVGVGLLAVLPSSLADPPVVTATVPELHCPPTARQPAPPVPHVAGLETEGTEIPTEAEVGDLATPVDLNPPVLDLTAIPEFALKDGAGAPRPRRFAFWGDSHIAAGPMMGQLVQAIRARGETVGVRFLPPTMGRANVRLPTLHNYCIGTGWSTALAFKEPGVQETGPALANRVAAAGPESYLWLDFRTADLKPQVARLQIVYRETGAEGEIAISINDQPETTAALNTSEPGSDFIILSAGNSIQTVKLRVTKGQLVLQGFILEYEQPPLVTLDVFGLPSSTGRGWANADPASIASALRGESYDGVVLEYGTNDGAEADFDRRAYADGLAKTLTSMRAAFPKASCVLVGPPDRGVLLTKGGPLRADFLKYAKIHAQIAAVQEKVGDRFGCVPWDWQGFMGGPGASYGWAHHNPVLMGSDLTHLTMEGYKRSGMALAVSLGWAGPDQSVYPR